jgi:ABC-type sugar transport system substrate-binding protein
MDMNRRTSRRIAAITISLLLAVMLGGCASRPPWPAAAEQSGLDLEQRVILDQVPFYAQELYQCGPASLAMMLNA